MTPVRCRLPGTPTHPHLDVTIRGWSDKRTILQSRLFPSACIPFRIHAAIKLTVPDRQTLIRKLLSEGSSNDIDALSVDIVQSCNTIERTTQDLFDMHNLTELP